MRIYVDAMGLKPMWVQDMVFAVFETWCEISMDQSCQRFAKLTRDRASDASVCTSVTPFGE